MFTYKVYGESLNENGVPSYYNWRVVSDNTNLIYVRKKYKTLLMSSPCSIYILSGPFKSFREEFVSYEPVSVIKELKYTSPIKALLKTGWRVKWI